MIGTGIGLGLSEFRLAPGNWNPTRISGLQLWLDASDASTLYQSSGGSLASADGDPVGQWLDKSSNARHANQTDGVNKPALKIGIKNNKDTLRFDGIGDFMVTNSSFTFKHIFCVLYLNTSNFYATALGADEVDAGANPKVILRRNDSNGWSLSNSDDWTAAVNIRVNGSATSAQSNQTWSVISAPRSAGYTDNFILSSRFARFFKGDFAEVIVFDSVLTGSNLSSVENYLNSKWGIY